ncbi:hypothetical protein Q4Q39_12760 [Flavivirga amylovorans]|uniref:Lipocalin-like domain-containing protein n=1 Tax=Flavivirga amylovorans TaxID=870486 RepID=A0ABT8X2U6_9FLAO|nr:hypothetical protein [Flavivirga amylovorans]MDO5988279.1 hypothetical protein [Flavivirga amylovorans]
MKNFKNILGTVLMSALLLTSCSNNDDNDGDNDILIRPTAEDFNNLKEAALENLTQTFEFNADDGSITLTSEKGVQIFISSSCLTLNGESVTGTVDVEFIELFDKGSMLTTNKPTMGTLPNGDKALLISGGEFFVNATQNGATLETTCGFQMLIPADLTGGVDEDMTLWEGRIDQNGNLAWGEVDNAAGQGEGGVFGEGDQYYGFFQSFGWSNVDRFYNDPRPKTTILVAVPEGYDNTNSSVFISYDGEDAGLANLDTYDSETGLFSEHYGQIPVGLECHIIFATEDGDNWKYAIKSVTIEENAIITFTDGETSIATEAQLTTIINDLP